MDRSASVPAVLVLRDPLGDAAALRACLSDVVAGTGALEVRCDISLLTAPGLADAGVLAHLRLIGARAGVPRSRSSGRLDAFVRLLVLVGLGDVVPCSSARDPLAPEPGSSR